MTSPLENERARLEEAVRAGAHHRVVLHLVRGRLLAGSLEAPEPASDRPLHLVERRPPPRASGAPVAFLATFTRKDQHYVIPLKQGVNRVGRNPMFSDFADLPPNVKIYEGRQWLAICSSPTALAADDHSTNQSILLKQEARIGKPEIDPRSSPDGYSYVRLFGESWPGKLSLDWGGDVMANLEDGDVLLTAYAGFVFGWLPR